MATFRSLYLIHGDDHGRIAERRARLRQVADEASGAAGVEQFEGEASTPQNVANALAAMTFVMGRRFLIVDGVERWKEKELKPLEAVLADMPPETTVAFFAREEGRAKVPPRLVKAVDAAGGHVSAENSLRPRELPKWVQGEAKRLGLRMQPDAARQLIAQVGERQQRLLRELEKLALTLEPGAEVGPQEVELLTSESAELKVWSLSGDLVRGETAQAVRTYLTLRGQGERLGGLLFTLSSRMSKAHQGLLALERGRPAAKVKLELGMSPYAAERLLADARKSNVDRLRQGVVEMADLELGSRGGADGPMHEDTAAIRAIARM